MGKLKQLLTELQATQDIQVSVYSTSFPQYIAKLCTEAEVADAFQFLEASVLEFKAEQIRGELNGDDMDDIWRAELRYAQLLADLIPRYPVQIAQGLKNDNAKIRFWIAWAIDQSPIRKLAEPLDRALAIETDEFNRKIMRAALEKCRKKWKFW
jgi:hypothetical protein